MLTLGYLKRNWEFLAAAFVVLYFVFLQVFFEKQDLGKSIRVLPQDVINAYPHQDGKFAYMQYATNKQYLELAINNFVVLERSGSRIADKVIIIKLSVRNDPGYLKIQTQAKENGITLVAVPSIEVSGTLSPEWADSFTKFHIFGQTQYDRVVYFDADSMFVSAEKTEKGFKNVPKPIDELFNIPKSIDIALPQAYWVTNDNVKPPRGVQLPSKSDYERSVRQAAYAAKKGEDSFPMLPKLLFPGHKFENRANFFASHVIVFTPSSKLFKTLKNYVHNPWLWLIFSRQRLRQPEDYDMEIINRYLDETLRKNRAIRIGILPHQVYGVLTGEFKELYHRRFVARPEELPFVDKFSSDGWNATEALLGLKMIHFSDAPIPKPWQQQNNHDYYNAYKIYCYDESFDPDTYHRKFPDAKPRLTSDCASVEIWNWLMAEFHRQRVGM